MDIMRLDPHFQSEMRQSNQNKENDTALCKRMLDGTPNVSKFEFRPQVYSPQDQKREGGDERRALYLRPSTLPISGAEIEKHSHRKRRESEHQKREQDFVGRVQDDPPSADPDSLQSPPPAYTGRACAPRLPRRSARRCHLAFVRGLFPAWHHAASRSNAPASFRCGAAGPGFPFADKPRTPQWPRPTHQSQCLHWRRSSLSTESNDRHGWPAIARRESRVPPARRPRGRSC